VSWFFVKIMLILNYLGQGSWLLENYNMVFTGTNPFFGMLPQFLIIPAVILATAAAIIASQALITGSFTIFSEAMSLNFWPFQQIEYPSGLKGQMYIPRINWGLLIMCIVVVFYFKESVHMEAAYGLSITVTMLMTTVLVIFWLWRNRVNKILIAIFAMVYFAIELGFFGANIIKFFEGGWITVVLAGFVAVDPATLTAEQKQEKLNAMWRNGCINDTYEPGSTFKIITAAAGLEAGVVTPESTFSCPGFIIVDDRKIRCHKIAGHGGQTFVQCMENSCNQRVWI
jgi:K+ transporter